MNQVQADRFATHYHFIKGLKPKKVFMDTWVLTSSWMGAGVKEDWESHALTEAELKGELENPSCKTAACVCGWMPVVFPRMMEFQDRSFIVRTKKPVALKKGGRKVKLETTKAMMYMFGIDSDEADRVVLAPNRGVALRRMVRIADKYGFDIR